MKGRTSPLMPRAIYFGDDVYDAWLQGSDLPEIAAALFFPIPLPSLCCWARYARGPCGRGGAGHPPEVEV